MGSPREKRGLLLAQLSTLRGQRAGLSGQCGVGQDSLAEEKIPVSPPC